MPLRPGSLASGMVLTRDLKHPQGYLLLAKGEVVASEEIEQLLKIEAAEGIHLMLYVAPPSHA